jgi:hypothetical protein
MSYPLTAAFIGLLLAALIVFLLRKDRLYVRDAIFWLVTAAASVLFAFFPRAIDWLGSVAGIAYPPALLLGVVCGVITIKSLLSDIEITRLRRDVRRLNQRIALIESNIAQATTRSRAAAKSNVAAPNASKFFLANPPP